MFDKRQAQSTRNFYFLNNSVAQFLLVSNSNYDKNIHTNLLLDKIIWVKLENKTSSIGSVGLTSMQMRPYLYIFVFKYRNIDAFYNTYSKIEFLIICVHLHTQKVMQ